MPLLHPKDALDKHGRVIETKSARLKISIITGKYLVHGHNSRGTVEYITLEDDPQSDDESVCNIELPVGDGITQPMDQSMPMEIVEALVHSNMENENSRWSSASSRSAIVADGAGSPDEIEVVVTNQDENQADVELVVADRAENPDEIEIITIDSDDGEFEEQLISVAPQL